MSSILEVNLPAYWKSQIKPQNFEDFCDMVPTDGRITGIWEMKQTDRVTGEIIKRVWNKNVVTDQGANYMLQRAVNSSGATLPALFNNILITNNSGSTTLNASLAANATSQTTLTVVAIPAAIPSGTTLTLRYGGSNTQNVVTNGAATQGATSITVVSFTVNSTGFSVGDAVVPNPAVTDNPASTTSNATTPLTSYSGNLSTGAFTYTPTTGAGNRQVVVVFQFTNGGGTAVGNYTDAWIVNVASGATTNSYMCHEINSVMRCDTSNNITCTITLKV